MLFRKFHKVQCVQDFKNMHDFEVWIKRLAPFSLEMVPGDGIFRQFVMGMPQSQEAAGAGDKQRSSGGC